jgi:hypothetical protein
MRNPSPKPTRPALGPPPGRPSSSEGRGPTPKAERPQPWFDGCGRSSRTAAGGPRESTHAGSIGALAQTPPPQVQRGRPRLGHAAAGHQQRPVDPRVLRVDRCAGIFARGKTRRADRQCRGTLRCHRRPRAYPEDGARRAGPVLHGPPQCRHAAAVPLQSSRLEQRHRIRGNALTVTPFRPAPWPPRSRARPRFPGCPAL